MFITEKRNYDCDHYRAFELYAESVAVENAFRAMRCHGWPLSACTYKGGSYLSGYPTNHLNNVNGLFVFFTNEESPYHQENPFAGNTFD